MKRNNETLRVMMAGGSTGGHLMPGVATADALCQAMPGTRVLFLVTNRKAERHCSGVLGRFETAAVPDTPWHGAGGKALFPARCLLAARRVLQVLHEFRPHVALGLGSYNSAVPALLARACGVPTALLEANAVPGAAVRMLAPLADCVLLQWGKARPLLRARRAVASGLPVRREIVTAERAHALRRLGLSPDKPTLLATGGSQGALALNQALFGAVRRLYAEGVELQVIHLTGVDHLQAALDTGLSGLGPYRAIGFLDRMQDAYAAADFALARAGGSTLAELTAVGLPSILVPYPYAANAHQQANARLLAHAGAAIAIDQKDLTVERLADCIRALATDASLRARMAECAQTQGRPDAARRVAQELAVLAGFGRQLGRTLLYADDLCSRSSQAA